MLIARSQRDCDNAATDKGLKPSLKVVLAESHIGLVAILVLLFMALRSCLDASWYPFFSGSESLAHAIANLELPNLSSSWQNSTFALRMLWVTTGLQFGYAAAFFLAAKVISQFVYGAGPLRALARFRQLQETTDV
jgi:hypothetical protein